MLSRERITWAPEMSVGVQALDDDHKILVGCLNDFIDACENDEGILVTDSIFSILLDYTGYHFAREEKVMEVCGYKGLAAHKELHQALAEKVVENRTRFVLNRDGELDEEVRQFLLHWLQKHILGCDMDYASDCAGKEKEIAAALESRSVV